MIYAGIVAGGNGTRMGLSYEPKQFLPIESKPIIIHTVEKFLTIKHIDKIVIGINPEFKKELINILDKYLSDYMNRIMIVLGGLDRNETILNICKAIDKNSILITHDAVRPFVKEKMILDSIKLIENYDVVGTFIPSVDTIAESLDGKSITSMPNRNNIYQAQTPQTFRVLDFLREYSILSNENKKILTDVCKIFLMNKKKVGMIEGEYSNIKITTPTDYQFAQLLIKYEKGV